MKDIVKTISEFGREAYLDEVSKVMQQFFQLKAEVIEKQIEIFLNTHPNENVLGYCISYLQEHKGVEAMTRLLRYHRRPEVRRIVAEYWSHFGDNPRARWLDDQKITFTTEKNPEMIMPLVEAVDWNRDSKVRANALLSLSTICQDAEIICGCAVLKLGDTDIEVRRQAVNIASRYSYNSTVTANLINLFNDTELAEEVSKKLQGITSATPLLIAATKDERAKIRYWALKTLSAVDEPAVVDAIVEAVKDPDSTVAAEALKAIAKLGEPAIKKLAEKLNC
jgi:HEAT repeat protein